ncbi:hypothetical protein BE08_44850 [Sorangium cellulosum]|uniref:Uncharacterized protein n=1 Tax=Sorangium cellulosum TaxID=56 RepID=A0A150PEW0_SORCE|nr:hypothetical protein BE08_44850 [Sorangium cellulosum]
MGLRLLSLKLGGNLTTKVLRDVLLDDRRQRERERYLLRPLRIFRIEIRRGTRRAQHTITEFAHMHLGARPLMGMPDQSGGHRIREDVGDLLHHRRARQQPYHARGFVVPHRPFPPAQDLRAERNNPMKELQEARQHAICIGHDDMQMR